MALPEPEATLAPPPRGAAGLRGIWRDFVTSGLEGDVYSSAMRRVRFLNVFALVTIVTLLAFGVYNVVSRSPTARPLVGLVEMIAALLGSLILLHLRIGRNVGQAQDLTMTLTLAVMTFLLYTGGMERTGIFWWFCFPAGAFYLKGLRGGWWWVLGTLVVFGAFMAVAGSGAGDIPYSVVTLRQFVAAYLVVSLLVAAYEVIRNDYERLAECTAREITSANQRLNVEVNERRRAQEAMQAATEEAKRANLAKSAFLSRMSHEFRTPMNSILGFSQLMESDTREPLPEAHKRSVREILNSGRHLLELINEVLDLARIEAGRVTLTIETVALAPLVRETIATVKPLADTRRIAINVSHQDGELFVRADPTRLRQVLLNLLSNAIKYNRDAGQIRVETRRPESGVAEIRVTDTGYGIPEEKQTLVFAPFERLAQTDSVTEGSGIGLAISRQLVSLMQGSITFTSTPGLGTCFAVTLPVSPTSGANDAAPVPAPLEFGQAAAAVPPGTGTVLYVEDDLTNLALVRQILMRRPLLRLLHAADGAAGIAMARAHAPDLVLLDIRLPDMSGVEVLRAIRSDPTTLRLPVVVVTASAMPHEMKALENADIARCLTKPLDVVEFLETVDMVLSAPGPERRQVTDAPV